MIKHFITFLSSSMLLTATVAQAAEKKQNVLFIIADDLTATALSCYENKQCKTPNIDKLASEGVRYTRTYCQFPVCGPSRASMMSGYYPLGSGAMGYASGRKQIGDRPTWAEHFKRNGYHTARVSKIFHMNVPGHIVSGSHGADDPRSWNERHNSKGPEHAAKGEGEMLERNPDGTKPVRFGNHLQYVKADGDDLLHSDGKTAEKTIELLKSYKQGLDKPFFLAVGMVRPHVPFVSPRKYYEPYPVNKIVMPEKVKNDQNDIPKSGLGQFTSKQRQISPEQERKAVAAYYASVSYMDAQVGKILATLKEQGLEDNTIVIFTSDHGYHLAEHEFWMKVSLHEESARVPMIIKVPGKKPAVCHSFTELIDLYPTISEACGLEIPKSIQGKSIAATFDDPKAKVREFGYCVNKRSKGSLIRTDRWALMSYGKNGKQGYELYDMKNDPKQYTNLAKKAKYKATLEALAKQLADHERTIKKSDIMLEKAKK